MMANAASLAQQGIRRVQAAPNDADPLAEIAPRVRKLFILMHGSYGNAFVGKFATGEKLKVGEKQYDKGVLATMRVWQGRLTKYPESVIELAAGRIGHASPEFPPSLPQFEKLCEAAMPRKTYAKEQGLRALSAQSLERLDVPIEAKGDGRDWARRIVARKEKGDKTITHTVLEAAKYALRKVEKATNDEKPSSICYEN